MFASESETGTSLGAQRMKIHLPVQGNRFNPWSGKIPHAAGQLSLCATVREPVCYNY